MPDNWVKVEDRLPKDRERVWCYGRAKTVTLSMFRQTETGNSWFEKGTQTPGSLYGRWQVYVSHWMPLEVPGPPEEGR